MLRTLIAMVCLIWSNPVLGQTQSAYPQPDVRITQGDWLVECYGDESRNGNCQLYHRVLMNNGTAIALVLTVAYTPDGQGPYMQLALPLGSDLPSGAQLTFGTLFDRSIPFTRCTDQGCLVEGEITQNLLQAMRVTSVGYIGVRTDAGPLNIPVSMNGFAAGIDRLRPLPAAAAEEFVPPSLEEQIIEPDVVDQDLAPVTGQ